MASRLAVFILCIIHSVAVAQYSRPVWPFAGGANATNSTAITYDDPAIKGWATSVENYSPGTNVDTVWQDTTEALGPAGSNTLNIVSLGAGGQITLEFFIPIQNGQGFDFAVFENGISDGFLELAFVEVSTDGIHFVRFPAYSYTANPVAGFGELDPTNLENLASKYRIAFGTPFDLQILEDAYQFALTKSIWSGSTEFSQEYRDSLVANYPHVDILNINYVRLIDIAGNGDEYDCEGFTIYDPYPTNGSAGFDLDGIGVLYQQTLVGTSQHITFPEPGNQILANQQLTLNATASSGLPVSYEIVTGNAILNGNVLTFQDWGLVIIEASQQGNTNFAAAAPVSISFYIADALQHINVKPVPNIPAGVGPYPLSFTSSSGLPVQAEIVSGPSGLVYTTTTETLDVGFVTGSYQLRLFQPGNGFYAPAEDILIPGRIVQPISPAAPQTFAQFAGPITPNAEPDHDTDGDGAADFLEYAVGTDLTDPQSRPIPKHTIEHRNGQQYFVVKTYARPTAISVDYSIELGNSLNNLLTATPPSVQYERVFVDSNELIQIEYAFPIESGELFIRQAVQEQ